MTETLFDSVLDSSEKFFSDALHETVSTMTGFDFVKQADMLEEISEEELQGIHNISGAMLLTGERNVLLLLTADRATAAMLVSYMTGTDISNLEDFELYDGMIELVNMLAGPIQVRLRTLQCSLRLSSPFGIVGSNTMIIAKKGVERYKACFKAGEMKLTLKIFNL